MIGKSCDAAEAANPNRHRLRRGRSSAARERKRNIEAAALRQAACQQSCFRSAAENENARHVAS
jgi:hypothetical protein